MKYYCFRNDDKRKLLYLRIYVAGTNHTFEIEI
jgi:hypothetical protein